MKLMVVLPMIPMFVVAVIVLGVGLYALNFRAKPPND